MKEVKKTGQNTKNNTPKKNNTSNKKPNDSVKKQNTNQNVSEAPRVTKIESPVKETKNAVSNDDFIEEDNDQKLIVIIAIAILVILVTIMCLLVGCERKEEEEPENPNEDEIVVPVQVDEDEEEEEDEVVVKVTTTKSTKDEEEEEEVKVEIPTYNIIYYYSDNEKTHHESADEGTKASEYVPEGYSTCKYYKDENYLLEYEFDNIYEDANIYLNCEEIEYTIVYHFDETIASNNELNPLTFTVKEPITLEDLNTDLIFVGWYLDNEYTQEVYELNRNIVQHADDENTIYLYANIKEEITVELFNSSNENVYNKTFTKEESQGYTLPEAEYLNACSTEGKKFLGWTTTKNSKNVEYKDAVALDMTKNYTLYAVCGDATIVYTSNGETVTVGYTNEELLEEGFDLPKPSDVGIEETPVYFIPVDEETLTSKKIVSDDEIELGENEVYFSQVKDNTKPDYTPNIGDNVEVFEKEFVGWIEKTEEVETPETEATTPEEETNQEEGMVPEEGTESTQPEKTETTEEELDLVTKEEVVDEITNSTDEEVEVELEAVWEIPEDETTSDAQVEVTPETGAEQLPTA